MTQLFSFYVDFFSSSITDKTFTGLDDIYIYMSNTSVVLQEAGTSYLSRTLPVFGGVRIVLCFLFVFVLPCVPNVVSVSGLSILDCSFGFL